MAFILHSSVSLASFQTPKVLEFSGYSKFKSSSSRNKFKLSVGQENPTQTHHLVSSQCVADFKSKTLNYFLSGTLALALSLTG